MNPKIHYLVRHAKPIIHNDQLDYEIIAHKFQDDEPIKARKKAFKEYTNLQEVLDERRQLNKAEGACTSFVFGEEQKGGHEAFSKKTCRKSLYTIISYATYSLKTHHTLLQKSNYL